MSYGQVASSDKYLIALQLPPLRELVIGSTACVVTLEKGMAIACEFRLAVKPMTNSHSHLLHVPLHSTTIHFWESAKSNQKRHTLMFCLSGGCAIF